MWYKNAKPPQYESDANKLKEIPDSVWVKIRYFFFNFFHTNIIDLAEDKFTKGYGEGYKFGFKSGREQQQKEDQVLISALSEPVSPQPKPFPLVFELEKVFTVDRAGHVLLNGILIEDRKLDQLKTEAIMFKNSLLWEVITNTLDFKAQEIGWNLSKEYQDLANGKMVSYTIQEQQKIVEKLYKLK